jgi:hypothetical protein
MHMPLVRRPAAAHPGIHEATWVIDERERTSWPLRLLALDVAIFIAMMSALRSLGDVWCPNLVAGRRLAASQACWCGTSVN